MLSWSVFGVFFFIALGSLTSDIVDEAHSEEIDTAGFVDQIKKCALQNNGYRICISKPNEIHLL